MCLSFFDLCLRLIILLSKHTFESHFFTTIEIDTIVYLQSSTPIISEHFHMNCQPKTNLATNRDLPLVVKILVPRFLYLTQQVLPRLEPYRVLADDWAADLTDLRCGQGFGSYWLGNFPFGTPYPYSFLLVRIPLF